MTQEAGADKKAPSVSELEDAVKKAAAAGNMDEVYSLVGQIGAAKEVARKAAAERLARARQAVNERILAAVRPVLEPFTSELAPLGGVVRVLYDANEKLIDASIGEKAAPRAKSGAAPSGNGGVTSEKFGRTLASVFEEFASPEERAEHDALPTSENSKRWTLKKRVRDRAVRDGLLRETNSS